MKKKQPELPGGNRFRTLEDVNSFVSAIRHKTDDPTKYVIPRYIKYGVRAYIENPEWTDAPFEEVFRRREQQ